MVTRTATTRQRPARTGRAYIPLLLFLAAYGVLIVVVSRIYLLPHLAAAQAAAPDQRRSLAAGAMIVLIILLFVLIAGLLLTLRIGRFFFPRPVRPVKPTEYVDAWAESARRMPTPPPEE